MADRSGYIFNHLTYAKLETMRVPTLLMPGDQDLQTPPWVMRR
jgi:hypothetical protein